MYTAHLAYEGFFIQQVSHYKSFVNLRINSGHTSSLQLSGILHKGS